MCVYRQIVYKEVVIQIKSKEINDKVSKMIRDGVNITQWFYKKIEEEN